MALPLQAKMLRVLENFEFSRLGGSKSIGVDVRVIAASNREPEELIQAKNLRIDLYHRLNGVRLHIPPLRERREDIVDLAHFFIQHFNGKYHKEVVHIDNSTIDIMNGYSWPGNVREMKNCLERAIVVCDGDTILPDHLPDRLLKEFRDCDRVQVTGRLTTKKIDDYRNNYMRKLIIDTLKEIGGNRSEAARKLKISRRTLYNRMKELTIKYDFI